LAMSEPVMRSVSGDGVEIQLALWEGTGRTVLCVHGLTANCRCWDRMARALTPSCRVAAADLRGRGDSGKPETGYSVEHHCRDIRAVLDGLDVERPVLMGHSLGALVALAFAARHPGRVDRVVAVDGGAKLSEEQMEKVLAGIKPAVDRLGKTFPSFEAYAAPLKAAPFFRPWTPELETYFRYEAEEADGGVRSKVKPEHVREELANLAGVDASELHEKVRCPVLVLRATEGMLAPDDLLLPEDARDRMLEALADARCVDVEGSNHYTIVFGSHPGRDAAVLGFVGG